MPENGLSARFEYLPVSAARFQLITSCGREHVHGQSCNATCPYKAGLCGYLIICSYLLFFTFHSSYLFLLVRPIYLPDATARPHWTPAPAAGATIRPRYHPSKTGAWCYWGFGVLGAGSLLFFCFFKLVWVSILGLFPWHTALRCRGTHILSPPSIAGLFFLS